MRRVLYRCATTEAHNFAHLHSLDVGTDLDEISDGKLLGPFGRVSRKTNGSDDGCDGNGCAGNFRQNSRIESPSAGNMENQLKIFT